jgi:two-component system, LytTR family, response regulator LytT
MQAIIIEDEFVAADKLQRLINQSAKDIQVIAVLQTVDESIEWFTLNAPPDLVFMDIHLADGSSFSIFDEVRISCPIIFTTAYDEYALKAFEVNSIDYLLKPIDEKSLERAIAKFRNITVTPNTNNDTIANLIAAFKETEKVYKSNFLLPVKDKLIPLPTEKIACFYTENKMIKIITIDNQTYSIDSTLEEIFTSLDPSIFFRANRQFIVSHKAIKDISIWFGSKLSINMTILVPEKIIVSKARVSEFKAWYTK